MGWYRCIDGVSSREDILGKNLFFESFKEKFIKVNPHFMK